MKKDRKIKNVVLIMLDTLQFNYLGCYGQQGCEDPQYRFASPVRASSSKTPTVKACPRCPCAAPS